MSGLQKSDSRSQMADGSSQMADDRLREGMAALRGGRREEARRLLAQAVSADPRNAAAWLWLSRCVDGASQRQECLRRVLSLEPGNEAARRAMGPEQGAQLRRILAANVTIHEGHKEYEGHEGHEGQEGGKSQLRRFFEGDTTGSGVVPKVDIISKRDKDRGSSLSRREQSKRLFLAGEEGHRPSLSEGIATRNAQHAIHLRFDVARRGSLLAVLAVAIVALACVLAPRLGWPASQAQPTGGELLEASGIIQAEQVLIASEWGGQVAAIPVDEGDLVAAGDVIVQLDTALLDAQIEVAQAAVALAEAGLAQAEAGVRPGQIAVAEAQLAQAQAARLAATQAVSDTMALVENPQDIRLQIAVAQAQIESAQHQVAQAVALKDGLEIAKDKFEEVRDKGGRRKVLICSGSIDEIRGLLPPEIRDRLGSLVDGVYTFGGLELHVHGGIYDLYKWVNVHIPLELHLMPNSWWQAWVGVNAAVAQQEGIESLLAHLYAQWAHPQSLEAMADEALAALTQAEAQIVAAQAQVDGLNAGATREQIVALEARVAQAQAALDSLLTQRAMMTLTSPVDGTVVSVVAHPGEVAAPGASLLTVADLSQLYLSVYLPETRIGQVHLGQRVQVVVDSFPGRFFEGQVTHIASHAEFTPRNVATKEERVNLVFAVEIRLPNDDGALKPGMPADAAFGK
jgi:multidrug resistance efflux pump